MKTCLRQPSEKRRGKKTTRRLPAGRVAAVAPETSHHSAAPLAVPRARLHHQRVQLGARAQLRLPHLAEPADAAGHVARPHAAADEAGERVLAHPDPDLGHPLDPGLRGGRVAARAQGDDHRVHARGAGTDGGHARRELAQPLARFRGAALADVAAHHLPERHRPAGPAQVPRRTADLAHLPHRLLRARHVARLHLGADPRGELPDGLRAERVVPRGVAARRPSRSGGEGGLAAALLEGGARLLLARLRGGVAAEPGDHEMHDEQGHDQPRLLERRGHLLARVPARGGEAGRRQQGGDEEAEQGAAGHGSRHEGRDAARAHGGHHR
mmetsp:Transcript_116859/g.308745  ORF Transcript_116859/g.308745 Transcript_116859/m.308745 type:complete len:326 (+) Transcript_116859:61-1038(+)